MCKYIPDYETSLMSTIPVSENICRGDRWYKLVCWSWVEIVKGILCTRMVSGGPISRLSPDMTCSALLHTSSDETTSTSRGFAIGGLVSVTTVTSVPPSWMSVWRLSRSEQEVMKVWAASEAVAEQEVMKFRTGGAASPLSKEFSSLRLIWVSRTVWCSCQKT